MPEEFSKPLAPNEYDFDTTRQSGEKQPLTNADFRRLLQTPSVAASSEKDGSQLKNSQSDATHSFTHRAQSVRYGGSDKNSNQKKPRSDGTSASGTKKGPRPKNDEEDDELLEIMKKYRDRARERRQGEIQENQQEIDLIQSSGYKAVAPDIKINLDLAEKRKKVIEESKYLGGDMEHTHLVKGLDYALLQKVRSEILSKEREEDDIEKAYQARKNEIEEIESQLKSPLARNIYNAIFKSDAPLTINELFAPRRMAYVIEMDEEFAADSEIPTTLIRSKQDCPVDETSANLSINDVVIQKLTQVLSYLRADNKKKKRGKDKVPEEEKSKLAAQNIYDDVGDYAPNLQHKSSGLKAETQSKPKSYFDNPQTEASRKNIREDSKPTTVQNRKEPPPAKFSNQVPKVEQAPKTEPSKSTSKQSAVDSYAECYPGGYECYDAAGDSDDDADFSKMDLGNKKGPVRRWDFETEQEYEDYMSMREALPKAAFQYGVKMLDGRKTRKLPGGMKSEQHGKAKIDRQWAQISQILAKRKDEGDDSEPSKKIKF